MQYSNYFKKIPGIGEDIIANLEDIYNKINDQIKTI
jgi:hypothetical protein